MKRAISLVLTIVMVLSFGVCGAFAEGEPAAAEEQTAADNFGHVTTLDAGSSHYIGIKDDGAVLAVLDGDAEDDFGQCNVSDWTDIISVAAGSYFSLGLKSDGTVVATGNNKDNACAVEGWTDIIDIAAGNQHAVGLKSDGTVVTTGYTGDGACNVSGWSDIVDVAAGSWHTIGLRSDGTVVATGTNDDGECDVSGWSDIVAIDGGDWYTVGLKKDGTVVYAGGSDNSKEQINAVTRWTNIVAIRAFGSDDVLGIDAEGKLLHTRGQIVSDSAADVAVCGWNDFILVHKDGTTKSYAGFFDGVTLKTPPVYDLPSAEGENAEETDMGPWILKAYVDEFNLPTDDYFVVNGTPFSGTFSNSATTNSDLKALVFYEPYGTSDYISIRLFEYGNMRVKNPYSDLRDYDIVIMDNGGNKSYLSGSMPSQSGDILIGGSDAQTILDALKKGGTVRFAITESEDSLTKYIITIEDATGFDAAFRAYWAQ